MDLATTIEKWTRWNAGILLLASVLAMLLGRVEVLVFGSVVSIGLYFFWNREQWLPFGWLGGIANTITLFRWAFLLVLLLVASQLNPWGITVWALVVLVFDGLDGWLARKYNSTSVFGEYLDKETDAFYMLGMAFLVWQNGLAGAWILILGWLRYFYVLGLIRWKPAQVKEVRSNLGQIIAVVLMVGVALVFVLPPMLQIFELLFLTGLVIFTFGRSFLQLVRR
jgi:phosphatidylglycerophosphate synthase